MEAVQLSIFFHPAGINLNVLDLKNILFPFSVFLAIIKSSAIEPPNNSIIAKPEENSGTTTYPLAIPLLVVSGAEGGPVAFC